MSLRAALLAMLSAGPATGYDVAKRFHGSVGHVWHAPDSQIYPALHKLAAEGLISGTEVAWGRGSATKTEYAITPAGREALAAWQHQPLRYGAERDPAHLLAAYFEWADDPADPPTRLREHLAHYEAVREQALQQIRDIETRESIALEQRLGVSDPADWERIIAHKVLAYRGKILRAEAEIAWAEEGLELLADLSEG